jgi:hypothetical protein
MAPSVLQVLAWEVPWWASTIQGKVAIGTTCQPINSESAIEFSAKRVRYNSQGSHGNAWSWWHIFRPRVVTQDEEAIGPGISKDQLINEWFGLAKPSRTEWHGDVPRDGPKEHNEEAEWWMAASLSMRDSLVGFSDNNPQSHDDAVLQDRTDDPWSGTWTD